MTDINLHNNLPEQPSVVSFLDTNNSILGRIMFAIALCKDVQVISKTTHPKPRYSTARLQAMHQITLSRDIKVARLEQQLKLARLREQQDRFGKCAIRPLSRWYEGIKDPAIAAVYKSTLQLIRRLTRGRR
jgi:hypothetical protein